jgi:type IV secretory pathway TrbL component
VAVNTDVFDAPLMPGPAHVNVTPDEGLLLAVVVTAVWLHVIVPLLLLSVTVGVFTSGITVYTNALVQPDTGCVLINVYVVAVPTLTVLLFTPLRKLPPLLVHV